MSYHASSRQEPPIVNYTINRSLSSSGRPANISPRKHDHLPPHARHKTTFKTPGRILLINTSIFVQNPRMVIDNFLSYQFSPRGIQKGTKGARTGWAVRRLFANFPGVVTARRAIVSRSFIKSRTQKKTKSFTAKRFNIKPQFCNYPVKTSK